MLNNPIYAGAYAYGRRRMDPRRKKPGRPSTGYVSRLKPSEEWYVMIKDRLPAASWADPGLVFPNTRGKIRRRDSVMRSLRRFLEDAGLPMDVRFHDLRHTAGTLALQQGGPLHTVSRMLGNSDPGMILGRYAHVFEACARMPPGRWTNFFDPTFYPNRTQHHPPQASISRKRPTIILHGQGLFGHQPAPGYSIAS